MPGLRRISVSLGIAAGVACLANAAFADTKPGLIVDQATPVNVSRAPLQGTEKPKLARMADGALIAVFGEGIDVPGGHRVFDVVDRAMRNPYDIFASYSIDGGTTWSAPVNVSNTARLSSANGRVDLDGDGFVADHEVIAWHGDNGKPNLTLFGNYVYVTFTSKYCDPYEQRQRRYAELGGVTVPFSCVYAAQIAWDPVAQRMSVLTPRRVTTGARDAIHDMGFANGNVFVMTWQEDPTGLELGNAEGPGDGGSGAKVSHGTDIWYAWERHPRFSPYLRESRQRVTNNFTKYDVDGNESGRVGASRPVIALIGTTVVLAYEETKGLEGFEIGKYIRYHSFDFDKLGSRGPGDDATAGVGCLVSEPRRNARRPRLLTQGASAGSTRIVFLYRQGERDEGGPADIVMRRAVGGVAPDRVRPALPFNCVIEPTLQTIIGMDAQYRQNPAPNLSSVLGVGADSEANPIEDAMAHRGVLRGDSLVIGYTYTPDQAKARYAAQENYNFYIRRSADGGASFSDPVNVSNIPLSTGLTVREPRLVGAPGSGPNCPRDPAECQDANVLYAVFGTATNVYEQIGGAVDVDIFARASTDAGASFTDPIAITAGNALAGDDDHSEDAEAQIRISPDGRRMFAVWGTSGEVRDALFRSTRLGEVDSNASAVIEYYSSALGHYFMTAFAEEAAMLDAGLVVKGWARTGQSFRAYAHDPPAEAKNVCRFRGNPPAGPNSHFYTANAEECAGLKSNALWAFEGNAFSIATPGTAGCASPLLPVYRVYNAPASAHDVNHRYTTDVVTYHAMINRGWQGEGVVMCAPQ